MKIRIILKNIFEYIYQTILKTSKYILNMDEMTFIKTTFYKMREYRAIVLIQMKFSHI